jgi:hypothetical protein
MMSAVPSSMMPVAPEQPARLVVGEPGPLLVLPDQHPERQVDGERRRRLHGRRAGARIAEEHHDGRPQFQADLLRAGAMVDAGEDRHALPA